MNAGEHSGRLEYLQRYRQRGQVIEESLNERGGNAFASFSGEQSAQYFMGPEGRHDGCPALFEEVGDALGLLGMLIWKTPR